MKTIALIIMLIALFLLHRIAYPKQMGMKERNDAARQREVDISDVVVKSRFTRPNSGQLQTTLSTGLKTDLQEEKPDTFALGNEQKGAAIPSERLDEVFEEEFDPQELEIPPDEDEVYGEADLEEEAQELRQTMGREVESAQGWSIEEMTEAVEAIDNPTDEKGALLYRVEPTDMFEKLVSGDAGKAARIREVIERHIGKQERGGEDIDNENDNDNDWENFNMQKFLS